MEKITYSQVQSYLDCPLKWECRYRRGIVRKGEDISSLRIGSNVHEIIACFWKKEQLGDVENALNAKYPDREILRESAQEHCRLVAFARHFFGYGSVAEGLDAVSIERPISGQIINPKHNNASATSRTFEFAGVCDAVFFDTAIGETILGEHKTAAKVDGGYIRRVSAFDLQIGLYAHFLGQEKGVSINSCLYDVHEKPAIKLKAKQTAADYQEELAEWYKAEPRSWEERIPISEQDKMQAREVLWDVTQKILWDSRRGRFSQNPGACEKWGRFCSYHELCCSKDNPAVQEALYEKKEKNSEVTAAIAAF